LPSPVFVSTHSSWLASDVWLPPEGGPLSEEEKLFGNPGGGIEKFGILFGGCIIGPGPRGYHTSTQFTPYVIVLH